MTEEALNPSGVVAGLAAAACWALSGLMYTRVPLNAGAMATFKNVVGALCLLTVLILRQAVTGTPMFQASSTTWLYLSISGVLGLSLADIAYFRSLQILGTQKGTTLTLLTPISTALLGVMYLNEQLSLNQALWIVLTLVGIASVMQDQTGKTPEQSIRPGSARRGVACAVFGVATVAIGSVLLKAGTGNVDSFEGTFIRLLAAALSGVVFTVAMREVGDLREFLRRRRDVLQLCAAAVIGTVVGVWLMLVSFKYCSSAMASTLTCTSPLFVMLFSAVIYRRRVTLMSLAGAIIAVMGVCLLLMS